MEHTEDAIVINGKPIKVFNKMNVSGRVAGWKRGLPWCCISRLNCGLNLTAWQHKG